MIKVRYKARCCECDNVLPKGNYVVRDTVSGRLRHVDCDAVVGSPAVRINDSGTVIYPLDTELYGIEL